MLTDPVAILQEIIDFDGDCEAFSGPAICKRCPLGNKRIDGKRVSCLDYLNRQHNVEQKSAEEINALYKTAAEEELFTIELEKALE